MTVRVFTQPGCQPCAEVKQKLDDEGISYVEFDVTEDTVSREFVKKLGYQTVPVIVAAKPCAYDYLSVNEFIYSYTEGQIHG